MKRLGDIVMLIALCLLSIPLVAQTNISGSNMGAPQQKDVDYMDIYMYGVSYSFTDSVVYITPIVRKSSEGVSRRYFLVNRDIYEELFLSALSEAGFNNRIATIHFETKEKRASKRRNRLIKNLKKSGDYQLKEVTDFKF